MLDPDKYRPDFPILSRKTNGKPLVYLDNAATSQKPRAVLDAVNKYFEFSNANVHRGSYSLSAESSELYESARARALEFVGADSDYTLVFTRNATESLNLLAYSLLQSSKSERNEIVITELEHHSNLVPWQQLGEKFGFKINYAKLLNDGKIDLEHFQSLLSYKTKLASFTACSNVLGTITPVHEMAALARDVGALVVVDGAQATPHKKIDIKTFNPDFYAFSGHKMLAPTGIGGLVAKRDVLESLTPFLYGGDMIRNVSISSTTFNEIPWRFEAGTPNVGGAIGLAAAMDYLEGIGLDQILAHEQMLLRRAINKLSSIDGITLYGPADLTIRSGVLSFNINGAHHNDVASLLDARGIAVRSGDHCGQPTHQALGIQGSVRASFYLYNTEAEVDALVDGIVAAKDILS